MSTRVRTGMICLAAAVAGTCPALAQTTNLYHTNRTFKAVSLNTVGQPTAYKVYTMAGDVTTVVGPTNVVLHTNDCYAREYEAVALGYSSANAAWTSAVASYNAYSHDYSAKIYDNVGWVKGTHQAYGDWGAYLWYMQNHIDFQSSSTNFWVSKNSVTGLITKVLVGSLGDYAPMTNVVDVGPTNWPSITNFPGSGASTTAIYKANLDAYYQVLAIRKIPLGRAAPLTKYVIGKLYVPTKWGGSNTLYGADIQLFYTNGSNLTWDVAAKIFNGQLDANRVAQGNPCKYTVPENQAGWYYVKITNFAAMTVSNIYIESGLTASRPWNGWYWPTLDSVNPNLYDTGGSYTPLLDYDAVYGATTHIAEAANYSGGDGWWGHCWGWSFASVAEPQPSATTKNGVTFNQDEMEGLYTELAEGADVGWTWRVGDTVNSLPASPCTSAQGETIDSFASTFHDALHTYVAHDRIPLFGNLRAVSIGDPSEVWNHAIFEYVSYVKESPGGDEKFVTYFTRIRSNIDTPAMPSDGDSRLDYYTYALEFNDARDLVVSSTRQNWIKCSAYPPQCLATVNSPFPGWGQGRHCPITKANVQALY